MALNGGYWKHSLNGSKPTEVFLREMRTGFPKILEKCQHTVSNNFKCPSNQIPNIYPMRACYVLKAGRGWPDLMKIANPCKGLTEVNLFSFWCFSPPMWVNLIFIYIGCLEQ